MEKKHKVLIIKTGYSEFLEGRVNSRRVSLGDILRITPLLHLYKDQKVTWVTDSEAFPLLEENPFIERILPYDFTTALQLESEEFDTVINLEKIPGICALADKVRARRRRYGFTFDSQTGEAEAYDKAFDVISVGADPKLKKENKRTSQELLFEMVGEKWKGEGYILGYSPKSEEEYDVALNTQVGQKWPTKAWPIENWNKLEEMLISEGFKITRQDKQSKEILTDLRKYIDWINSTKVIVSNDSLGVHLGIALKKQLFVLFGSTPPQEVYFYGLGKALVPKEDFYCAPCFKQECERGSNCINTITPEEVFQEVKEYYKNRK